MLSAPAAIPATTLITFAPALAPAGPGIVTQRCARAASPMRWANPTAGTRPADTTKFGSSNVADLATGV